MRRVLVCGSRNLDVAPDDIARALRPFLPCVVVAGGAIGVDTAAETAAKRLGMPRDIRKPDYAKYGRRRAPLVRNIEMLDSGVDHVLAYWDGKSSGTAHTLTGARRRGITRSVVKCPG